MEKGHHEFRSLAFQGLLLNASLSRVLDVHAHYLTKLNLSDCEQTCTDSIGLSIAKCTNLVDLNLEFCRKLSSSVLTKIVTSCLDLVVLALTACSITDDCLHALFVDLSPVHLLRRRALHSLLIGRCKFLTEACLDSLCTAQNLRLLRLHRSEFLTPSGALRLATAIPNLNVLDISDCPNLPKNPTKFSMTSGDHTANVADYRLLVQKLTELLPTALINV